MSWKQNKHNHSIVVLSTAWLLNGTIGRKLCHRHALVRYKQNSSWFKHLTTYFPEMYRAPNISSIVKYNV